MIATISQIASALGISDRGVRKRSRDWQPTGQRVRGGGDTYDLDTISLNHKELTKIKRHLEKQAIAEALSTLPAAREAAPVPAVKTADLPALETLTKRQIAVMDARMWFIRLIEQRPAKIGNKKNSIKKTIAAIVQSVASGEQIYSTMAAAANDRKGLGRTLSSTSLMRFWSDYQESGKNPAALAPQDADARRVAREAVLISWLKEYKAGHRLELPAEIPAWFPYLLDEYRQPQKPDLAQAHRDLRRMLPTGIDYPSYDQVYNLMQKLPITLREKGRMTGAEYKSLLGYTSRDASMDDPFTIMQIDGHSLKAYVAHPTTGAHFHPEVCGIICLTTKVLGGWSAGWAESNETVADAFRHCCTISESKPFGSVPAIVEPDRGPGNLANVNADELTGRFARLGTTFLPPEKGGNPQGHGAIERSNKSIWIPAAKSLITYTGKDMDRVTRKRVYVKLEKDLKVVEKAGKLGQVEKTSELLLSWREFLAWLDNVAMKYNNTPHSALPMITDQQTGRRRHMTPLEALAQRISQGWEPVTYDDKLMPYLFMPHEKITVRRCQFTSHGNIYHSYELHHWHNREAIVAYDIHDAKQVWVLDLDERPICKAHWNGNRVTAQPTPVKQQAIQQRQARRLKNNDNKGRMIQGEAQTILEHPPELQAKRLQLPAIDIEPETTPVRYRPAQSAAGQQAESTDQRQSRLQRWLNVEQAVKSGEEVNEDDSRFYRSFMTSPAWKAFAITSGRIKAVEEEEK